jgi:hypothetical protein
MRIGFFTHGDRGGLKKSRSLEHISRWCAALRNQRFDFLKSLALKIGSEAMDRQPHS